MIQINEIIEELKQLFSVEDYESAEKIIEKAREIASLYDDTVAIFDANLCFYKGDYSEMWTAIRRGLECNPYNYELYVMLGEYYLNFNVNQAYLCYENALFYCDNDNDCVEIEGLIANLKSQNIITVNNVSFIVLSYNTIEYTTACIESIRKNSPESCREIVIVDNASTDGSVEWLRRQNDIVLYENIENCGFPKGCNQGVEVACKDNDIFLLNSDTCLTPNALFWLRMGLYENGKIGATGSVTNYAGNMQALNFENPCDEAFLKFAKMNNLPQEYPYEEKLYLIGFALLIKRCVYDKVGGLDERFSPGNYEDNDYGLRVLQAGYKNILCKNSFIIHYGSKTFGKDPIAYNNIFIRNAEKFKEKWSLSPNYYFNPRPEIVKFVDENSMAPIKILEIGCGCGATLAHLKGKYPNASTYGVEIVPKVADIAKFVSDVICADIEKIDFPWEENFFDYIIMGDVLEHLHEPSIVLKKLRKHLKKGGHIIVSMPNMKHYSVMLPLLINDQFSYTDAGILDTTHLKMYTYTEIYRLLYSSGYEIEEVLGTMYGEPKPEERRIIDMLLEISSLKDEVQYLAYQYIVKARK